MCRPMAPGDTTVRPNGGYSLPGSLTITVGFSLDTKLGFAHFKPRRRVNLQVGSTGQPGLSIYPVLRLDFVQKLDKL